MKKEEPSDEKEKFVYAFLQLFLEIEKVIREIVDQEVEAVVVIGKIGNEIVAHAAVVVTEIMTVS